MTTRRRVLVIGAGGLIGSHIASAFSHWDVVRTSHRRVIPGALPVDVTDRDRTRHLISAVAPDLVVLAAADPWVERCERQPETTRLINVEAAQTVASAAGETGAALVAFSSDYVFDGTQGLYGEQDPVRPINEYGRQKVELESIVRTLPGHLICRTSGVFGWEDQRKNFVCQLVDSLRKGREFIVPADQLITPTYAPDLARTVAALVERRIMGTVHLVGPSVLSRMEFAAMVCEAFVLPHRLVIGRPTDQLGLVAPRPRMAGLSDHRLASILGTGLRELAAALAEMRRTEPAMR